MTITQITNYVIFGTATDAKPYADIPQQTLFFEVDTGRVYKFIAGSWSLFSGDNKQETLTQKTLTQPVISQIKTSTGDVLTLPSVTDTLVGRTSTDTLSNKTFLSPIITSIYNGGIITIPSGARTLVARDTADTLLNKTISVNSNTLAATSQSVGDILVNNGTQFIRLAKGSDTYVLTSTSSGVQWSAPTGPAGGGISASASNTFSAVQTFNDADLALRNPANTFSATIKAGAQTADRIFTFPVSTSDTVVMTNTAQTLANKTLTSPVIASITNAGGTLTLPSATTDTIVTRNSTETLANKTASVDTNTINHSTTNTAGDILKNTGTKYDRLARGTANQVLAVNPGATDVTWTSLNSERTGTATASGNGTATIFNIAHGLGSIPYMALAICSSLSTPFTYTYTSTNIVVTFTSAPASGTNNVVFQFRVVA